jgi:hypothetical protein
MQKVTYQIRTRTGYDCEEIKTREDAVAFIHRAKQRGVGALCVYIDGVLSNCLYIWELRAMSDSVIDRMWMGVDRHGVVRDVISGEVVE